MDLQGCTEVFCVTPHDNLLTKDERHTLRTTIIYSTARAVKLTTGAVVRHSAQTEYVLFYYADLLTGVVAEV